MSLHSVRKYRHFLVAFSGNRCHESAHGHNNTEKQQQQTGILMHQTWTNKGKASQRQHHRK